MSEFLQRTALVDYNLAVLQQAQSLVEACAAARARARFREAVGPHLRHVIEHYDALLDGLAAGRVDYDARPRDAEIERQPVLILRRLSLLRDRLKGLDQARLAQPVRVVQFAGLEGEVSVECASCVSRELLFVASHAIHHFAVLRPLLEALGLQLGADFGKAPATVRHELERHSGVTV